MGTDINVMVEYRMPELDHFDQFNFDVICLDRNYLMFSLMAGVRPYPESIPVFEPRGFPPDRNFKKSGLYHEYEPNGHTPSWLTRDEYHQVIKEYHNNAELIDFDYRVLGDLLDSLMKNGAVEARVVFWFDS